LQVIATSIVAVFPPKVLVANTITCAEALHLFSTKLVLKNELLQFQLPSPFIFGMKKKLLHKLAWFPMNRFMNQLPSYPKRYLLNLNLTQEPLQ
jgi:hypothetical protein